MVCGSGHLLADERQRARPEATKRCRKDTHLCELGCSAGRWYQLSRQVHGIASKIGTSDLVSRSMHGLHDESVPTVHFLLTAIVP